MIELLLQADRLLAVGRVDQAEALYSRAAERDPQNAIAVVGMAKCESERGNERAAYALAVRALGIDPQNNVALRLEARLSEVLATRGQPVDRPPFVLAGRGAPVGAGARSVVGGTPAAAAAGARTPAGSSSSAGRTGSTSTAANRAGPTARTSGLLKRLLGR